MDGDYLWKLTTLNRLLRNVPKKESMLCLCVSNKWATALENVWNSEMGEENTSV